jgi:hypothetical protein
MFDRDLPCDNGPVMDEETQRIVATILHVSRKSGTLVTRDPLLTGSAILAVCAEWEATERSLVIPQLKDAPPWAAYELKILKLGRALDFVMRKLGCWKGRGPLLDVAAQIVAEVRYGRGRQSFAAALGEHGQGAYGAELAELLSDDGLAGYAMKALQRGANHEYIDRVLAAAHGGRPWVQSAARAYAAWSTGAPPATRRPRRTSDV